MVRHVPAAASFLCLILANARVDAADDGIVTRYPVVIKNGMVTDGFGSPAVKADVAIRDGKVVAIGNLPPHVAAVEIDAAGKMVAPGFIDVHTHADDDLYKLPEAENFVRDGVTTLVAGNCGGSMPDVAQYFDRLTRQGVGVNVATLYGHNTVLRATKGDRKGELTPEQMDKAKALVRKAMTDGAVGFSTGLIYNPGQFSKTEEIVELAKVAGEYNGIYATHMRGEGMGIEKSIEEALRIGREAKMRVEISHFKLPADAAAKLGGAKFTLGLVHAARDAGQDVWLDQYPYTASSTTISTLIPDDVAEMGIDKARKLVKDPAEFEKVLAKMVKEYGNRPNRKSLSYIVIAASSAFPEYNGLDVVQIAQLRKARAAAAKNGGELLAPAKPATKPAATGPATTQTVHRGLSDAPADVSMEDQCRAVLEMFRGGNAQCVFHTMNDVEVETIMRDPLVAIASDSGVRTFGVGVPHPRGYGTNCRVLGAYAREKKLFTMEEAVRRMTSMPAATFRLTGHGLLAVGAVADITIFDPATVTDRATFDQPHQYSTGVTDVLVNGVPVLQDGKMTGKKPGKPILGPGAGK